MVNTAFRSWLIAAWAAAVAMIVALSVAMGANLSTTVLVLAIGMAPGFVVVILSYSAPRPTVAEILHSVDTNEGRP